MRNVWDSYAMHTEFWSVSWYEQIISTEERGRWEENIKNDLKEMKCENVDWVHLAEEKVQWLVWAGK